MATNLRNKKVLITAGPTWVPIDAIRVISNISTGETGILLANEAIASGANVTLLLGPIQGSLAIDKSIKLIKFCFFDELRNQLIKELKTKKYDFVIHAAAVSDYRLNKIYKNKVSSGLSRFRIELVPNQKLLDLFKKIDRSLKIIAFKFEIGINKPDLIKKAKELLKRSKADLVVANTVIKGRYSAYIVSSCNSISKILRSKRDLTDKLLAKIGGLDEQS